RAVLDELVHHAVGHVHRNCEADADVAAAAGEDGRVDADQLASQIDESAAGVAWIDRRIGLNEVLVPVGIDARAGQAADDSGGDRMLQAEGVADRDHEVPDLHPGRITQRNLHQIGAFHLEYGHV